MTWYSYALVWSSSIRSLPMSPANPFKWRQFGGEIILLFMRWCLRYAPSYRDLEEMMQDRGLPVDHTTVYRWVQRYDPNWIAAVGPI